MEKIALTLGALAIAGCAASSQSAQMTRLDERTHRVSVHAISFRNREVEAFGRAQAEASTRCAGERMEVRPIKVEAGPAVGLPAGTVVLTFRCLGEGDPEFHRSAPVLDPVDRG